METKALESQLSLQHKILGHSLVGGMTEIRYFDGESGHAPVSDFFDSSKEIGDFVEEEAESVYIGINPRKTNSGKSEDVDYVTCLVFDLDPVRPRGSASSDAQLGETKLAAEKLASDPKFKDYSVLVCSGSGYHVYVPIEPIQVKDRASLSEALRSFTYQIKAKYATQSVAVDSIFDLPRVIRVWGSFNAKSKRTCTPVSTWSGKRLKFNWEEYRVKKEPVVSVPSETQELYEKRFERLVLGNKCLRDIVEGKAEYPSRSESDYAFISKLIGAHFTVSECVKLARKNPLGKADERTDRELEQEVRRIRDKVGEQGSVNSLATDSNSYYQELIGRTSGIPTGFKRWDEMTAGLKGGRFYVWGARPTDGKTTYLTQLAVNLSKQGLRPLLFPTEVSKSAIYDKVISCETGINLKRFQIGKFTEEEKQKIIKAKDQASSWPLLVCEDFSLTIDKIVRTVEQTAPDVVIVDFLQCLRYEQEMSASEMAIYVKDIKALAKKYNIPVILASQLSRRAEGVPASLAQLKGCGAIEEEGDVITFITTLNRQTYPIESMFMILKNKYGETGTIPTKFHASTCRFEEK